eukprot:gnl/TRDRNA2_/TRDRNA2_137070_c0_seq1.p1 gnl/TRDRNA2_/TRDRNA2_137070_c0~~gnl/TRDRNA2_/TRDRNA2_137070_c0_seq1.p1  ORF type:complete len:560 (-),score=58.41 gnl/TRDRNA2_/TRDRNA2_137070_c0_seq1:23-1660(-)
MYNDLYPQPQVNWYAGADAAPRNDFNGYNLPDPPSSSIHPAQSNGKMENPYGQNPYGPGLGNQSFNQSFTGVQGQYLQTEYGRPSRVAQAPSFFTAAAAQGMHAFRNMMSSFGAVGPNQSFAQAPPQNSFSGVGGHGGGAEMLVVNVDTALDLVPSDRYGSHYYYASAHYVGESQEEIQRRQTQAVKANQSSTNASMENCVLHKQISVPYNSRQQFVMVSIYEADQLGDTFIGQATVPLADPRLSSTAPWPLVRDGVQNGTVTLNVQLPGAGNGAAPSSPVKNFPPESPSPVKPSLPAASPYGPAPPPEARPSYNEADLGFVPQPLGPPPSAPQPGAPPPGSGAPPPAGPPAAEPFSAYGPRPGTAPAPYMMPELSAMATQRTGSYAPQPVYGAGGGEARTNSYQPPPVNMLGMQAPNYYTGSSRSGNASSTTGSVSRYNLPTAQTAGVSYAMPSASAYGQGAYPTAQTKPYVPPSSGAGSYPQAQSSYTAPVSSAFQTQSAYQSSRTGSYVPAVSQGYSYSGATGTTSYLSQPQGAYQTHYSVR